MAWLLDGEKSLKIYLFFSTEYMIERDKQTDRRTPHDDIGRACIALRGKNGPYPLKQHPDFSDVRIQPPLSTRLGNSMSIRSDPKHLLDWFNGAERAVERSRMACQHRHH